jgi:predicted phage tail protein
MNQLVEIRLHGDLGKKVGKLFKLRVKSAREAISAVNTITKGSFFSYLSKKEKGGAKYQVLINESPFLSEKPLDNLDCIKDGSLATSELFIKREDLKSIDIVPIIEGAGGGGSGDGKGILGIVLGAVLIVVGILVTIGTLGGGTPFGVALIMGGIGLVAAGALVLMSKPPQFEDFRELGGGRKSNLFPGPINVTNEGGPIPVGYGQLLIGSQVIAQNYNVRYVATDYYTAGE